MDDIICDIRWELKSLTGVTLRPLYVPVLSGPTAGYNFWNEVSEWARQIRRWSIGSVEVFHYACIKFSKTRSKGKTLIWMIFYFNYYGFFLITQGMLMVTSAVALNTVKSLSELEQYLQIGAIGITYLMLALIFVINTKSQRLLDEMTEREDIGLLRTVTHWLLSPFVMILYSFVGFYGIMEVAIKGKQVCKHGASKKNELK